MIPGVTVQAISGLNFWMYRRATTQFELFHVCLERMGRYLLANSVCENMHDDNRRDAARFELVRIMATAPMLPVQAVIDHPSDRTGIKKAKSEPKKAKAVGA